MIAIIKMIIYFLMDVAIGFGGVFNELLKMFQETAA
jgi:hypothetical protein